MRELVAENKIEELKKILLKRISFGTAGLRGKMSVGYACMNDLVIIQTAQGLLNFLAEDNIDLLTTNGIVVGYDGRHNSKRMNLKCSLVLRVILEMTGSLDYNSEDDNTVIDIVDSFIRWAELTTAIFIHAGYPVKLFSEVIPTPFIPFSVTKYKCASGVMVYGSNGVQIVSPTDKNIQHSILRNLEPLETSWDTSILGTSDLLIDPLSEVLEHYLQIITDTIIPEHKLLNEKVGMLFTYTAMHGVGYSYIEKVCDVIGINIVPVLEQRDPHPDFPTVKFPNPEEGKSSLDLSFKTADENNSVVIIANDPDADRMAAAEKNPKTGEWKVFTGNELGALFGWWMLHCYKIQHPNELLSKVCMISSTVSSMILRSISKAERFNFYDTLTGFKWIGNLALDLQKEGKDVIFCYEEAIGFMCSTNVLDKDGISAAFQFATMTSYIYSHDQTIVEKLEEIYSIYGQHVSNNSYYICHDPVLIKRIFTRIRNFDGENTPDNRAVLPVSSNSEMITFHFSNGLVCTLRTSGTEPKIKYYTEFCASPEIKDKDVIIDTLHEMVQGICEELLQPTENNLLAKSD
ncbi:hypothetical protein NQ314_006043 [Rhamnusium bicolor]|uniref:Phosphoglucomutase-2 n=1 Tax=Rhamnusium bicolor TaxID=1586634 RepID=A0AAV8ZBG1_9CUCU|nr:hypothetical protein NQ314_006043 [Rhamnusium bicolor]